MDRATEFTLTDVRCFEGEQRARLAPITLLVGENSTGKTTFLGCYSALRNWFGESGYATPDIDFNREPFSMGSFRDISRSKQQQPDRAEHFKCGIDINTHEEAFLRPYFLEITYFEHHSQPSVASIYYKFDRGNYLNFDMAGVNNSYLYFPGGNIKLNLSSGRFFSEFTLYYDFADSFLDSNMKSIRSYIDQNLVNPKFKSLPPDLNEWTPQLPRPVPIAPLRSKPKRTYDPVRETASPEGDHVPMLMMRLDRTDKDEWKSLRDGVVDFGRKAGMFADIAVRRLGRDMGDPFQLRVKARSGTPANLVDVGYGVSQSLPIVVDVCREKNRTFLLQQPEVHLHPRAQAELASLFVDSFKKNGNEFMIETHSDQIIDRVRILVRKGEIAADDVSILYFEPKRNAVQIHSLTLDEHGNLENAPPGYRDFFLKETDRLLGFDE